MIRLRSARSGTEASAPSPLVLLVDTASLAGDPELPFLLSFAGVEGITVEHHIDIVEPPQGPPHAVVGVARESFVGLTPLLQFRRFAAEISARPGVDASAAVIERALAFAHLCKLLEADAVVSPARSAFAPRDGGLLGTTPVYTVPEALAVIGAHVRQRSEVPLGGVPRLVGSRTEVYPLTARAIVPDGQEWWSACVRASSTRGRSSEWRSLTWAVFTRLGQALRGRDGVHEALRAGKGRGAILDALYHLDVVLMSSVGALDALAGVAHELFTFNVPKLKARQAAWQNEVWLKELRTAAPTVAEVLEPNSPPWCCTPNPHESTQFDSRHPAQ